MEVKYMGKCYYFHKHLHIYGAWWMQTGWHVGCVSLTCLFFLGTYLFGEGMGQIFVCMANHLLQTLCSATRGRFALF